ncbi:HAD-IA family hydrolase [Rubritalea spongiae]|uniref:HAD-IA family hydrolase n=1 Tax=Rubritalea spongiae TaxID=430797 RepID=A0ABW5E7M1_9BACT
MKTYLFDIGNVLLAFDFTPALNSLLGSKADPTALQQIITRKDQFEAGKVEITDYIQWASELLDFHGSEEDFKHAWCHIFTPIDATWALAKELKAQGNRLILYSNTNAIHAPFCLESYAIFEHFEHAVFSYEIGAIKPEDDFFLKSFEQFNIVPTDTFYIDDLPANIAAGKKHGLHTHLYSADKHQDLLDWIAQH